MIQFDVAIFGGGIAGLWALDALRRAGYDAALLESRALGAGQTICAQGIIHGGTKYSLKGAVTGSARSIAAMPDLWRACLAGEAEPNLSAGRVLSPFCYLWNTTALASRAGMLGAKMGLRVVPEALAKEDLPAALHGCSGEVLHLPEQVVDVGALLAALSERNAESIIVYNEESLEIEEQGALVRMNFETREESPRAVNIEARAVVFAAGAGNTALRAAAGLPGEAMQRRPLHMAMARGAALPEFYGHCVDGAKTRVTITSARDAAGRTVWQIGGQIAEDGVALESATLIERARTELAEVLPAVDLDDVEWATYRVDRAEGKTRLGLRPDGPVLKREGRFITAWPTKMVLAPALAGQLTEAIRALGISASDTKANESFAGFPRPRVAPPPWDTAEQWT